MKVVLQENVKGVGEKGEIKEVKNGYAMNFLIPQGKAIIATENNIKTIKEKQEKIETEKKQAIEKNKKIADALEGKTIHIFAKSQTGKLFGALKDKDIREALEKEELKFTNGKIEMGKIKEVGEYQIRIVWDNNIKANLVLIVGEK